MTRDCQAHHAGPGRGADCWSFLMRRIRRRDKQDAIEAKSLARLLGAAQMAPVNRVECPTKEADSHLFPHLPVAQDNELRCRQLFETHRSKRVNLTGTDSDL